MAFLLLDRFFWIDFLDRRWLIAALWNAGLGHSGLMLANLITDAHCGISRLMVAANSAGVLPIKSRPISSRLLRTSGIASTRNVSRWILSTIADDVPAGAIRPNHGTASKPG